MYFKITVSIIDEDGRINPLFLLEILCNANMQIPVEFKLLAYIYVLAAVYLSMQHFLISYSFKNDLGTRLVYDFSRTSFGSHIWTSFFTG